MLVRLALSILLPASLIPAQNVVPYYWSSLLVGGNCTVCAYDGDGAVQANIAYGTPFTTLRLAKGANGDVWGADLSASKIVRFTPSGVSSEVTTGFVNNIAIDRIGNLWTTEGGVFSPTNLIQRDPMGVGVLSSRALPAGFWVEDLMADHLDNIWMSNGTMGFMKYDNTGTLQGPLSPGVPGNVVQFEVDHLGDVWTLLDDGMTRKLVHHDNALTPLRSTTLPDAVAFALDRNGNPRVLENVPAGGGQILTLFTRQGTVVLGSPHTVSASSGDYTSLAIDTANDVWLTGPAVGTLILHCDGRVRASINHAPSSAHFGDRTGLARVAVLDRTGDTDGDLLDNVDEFVIGSDPNDPASPPSLVSTTPPIGGTNWTLTLDSDDPMNYVYLIGASLTAVTGIPLENECGIIPLDLDLFLLWWLDPNQNIITSGVIGTLDGSGNGSCVVALPAGIAGLTLEFCGMTFDLAGGVSEMTPARQIVFQ